MEQTEKQALLLDNQLCFPLYACSREIIKRYRQYLDPIGLTYTQYVTMLVMWEEQAVSVKALGARLYLDSGTLTPVLKSLEQKGLITRKRSEKDERVLIAALTEQGAALAEQAAGIPAQMCKNSPLTLEEAGQLQYLLKKLLSSGHCAE